MDVEVIDNVEQRWFELDLPDGSTATAYYRIDDEGRLVLIAASSCQISFAGIPNMPTSSPVEAGR